MRDIGRCRTVPSFVLSCCLAHSLANNYICYNGEMEGLNAIIAVLPKLPNLSSLKCASSKVCPGLPRAIGRCRAALRCGRVVASFVLPCYSGSLAGNDLQVRGTKIITEAIVKMPNLTSLKCAE